MANRIAFQLLFFHRIVLQGSNVISKLSQNSTADSGHYDANLQFQHAAVINSEFGKTAGKKDKTNWSEIWYRKLAAFHHIAQPFKNGQPEWRFSCNDVIQFLIDRKAKQTPAWKRLKIVEALIELQKRNGDLDQELSVVQKKLASLCRSEKLQQGTANNQKQGISKDVAGNINPNEPGLIRALRTKIRLIGHKYNTEKAYVKWVKRFLSFGQIETIDQCQNIDEKDVEAFLTDLVVDGNVAAKTQDQAFFGLKFFFEHVLGRELKNVDAMRSNKPTLRPTVLSKSEVSDILQELSGWHRTVAKLLYGCGLRISEAMRIRIKDLDFDNRQIVVVRSKGDKSRLVPMPEFLSQLASTSSQ